jgi:hypothetical protein
MQTTPTNAVANLILNLDPGNVPAPVARNFGASSGQTAQPKADNSAAPDRRCTANKTPRQDPATPAIGPDVRPPVPRTRPSNAKAREPAGPNAPARPRPTATVGEAPAKNKQTATANVTSAACSGGVFAQLLQQAAQAQATRNTTAVTAVASSKGKAAPAKNIQGQAVAPSPTQSQVLTPEKATVLSHAKPVQQTPQKGLTQATEQASPRTTKETKPTQTNNANAGQTAPTTEAKPLAAAVKPAASADHPVIAATVSPLQGQPQAAAMKATAPDPEKTVAVYKAGEKHSGRRDSASTSTQAAKLNQAKTVQGNATAQSVVADGAASVQSQTASTQGPVIQVSNSPLAKAAEVSVQGASRGTTQADMLQQAGETPVADQIVMSIRAAGAKMNQQVIVNLTPPELGKVRITLRSSGHEIRGILEADNPDTFRRLEREAAGLTQRLSDAGMDVRRMDVVMTRQESQTSSENPLPRDGSRQQPGADSESATHAAATQLESPEETTAAGADVVTSGSINVRI